MKTSTKILIAGVAVAVTAGGALAAQGMRHFGGPERFGKEMFQKADTDKDGAVTLEEMTAVITTHFDEADANGDGSVDKAEIIAAVDKQFERARRHSGAIADRIVFRLDMDGNGSIARSELENRARKMFALADFNDDGKVEIAEIRRMGPGHGPRMERAGWHHGGKWWRGDRGDDRGPGMRHGMQPGADDDGANADE